MIAVASKSLTMMFDDSPVSLSVLPGCFTSTEITARSDFIPSILPCFRFWIASPE